MKLVPYLNFEGNCEKAIEFYRILFNGNIAYKDYYSSAPMDVPDNHKDKIMHCQLNFGENMIMACDAFPGSPVQDGNGVELSMSFDEEEKAREIFNKLAEGGSVKMPFEQQFWGAWLGQLTDSFGKRWIISTNIYE
jgi:PhnB protein